MGAIQTFTVRLKTSNHPDAGTDGDVYIGMCGREFNIDSARSSVDDFERGSDRTYRFGEGHNVAHSPANDPRSDYPIFTEDIALTPAYIRFWPEDGSDSDHWDLKSVTVDVNNGEVQLVALDAQHPGDHLWLGVHSGMYCYLWTLSGSPMLLRRKRISKRTKASKSVK